VSNIKLDPVRLANALGLVTAAWYLICALLISTTPLFYMGMMRSWMHGFENSVWRVSPLPFGLGLYGFVTLTAAAWLTGYAFAYIYNSLGEKK